jgi:hypothetical protein
LQHPTLTSGERMVIAEVDDIAPGGGGENLLHTADLTVVAELGVKFPDITRFDALVDAEYLPLQPLYEPLLRTDLLIDYLIV